MKSIDLNCDMGELKPGQNRNWDAEIMPFISSCNVACGFHSGNPALMERTIQTAIAEGVKIGAHPSYNDREGFGRVSVQVERSVLLAELRYQVAAVKGVVESFGERLHHVKPHGALYNDMVKDLDLAADVVGLVKEIDPDLRVYTLANSGVVEVCRTLGMQAVNEAFADRRYAQVDRLMSRKMEGAVLENAAEIRAQVGDFLKGGVRLGTGEISALTVESICLHSDTPGAVDLGKMIHAYLMEHGIDIAAIR